MAGNSKKKSSIVTRDIVLLPKDINKNSKGDERMML